MKDLLLFVPGLGANEPGQYLRRLLAGSAIRPSPLAYPLQRKLGFAVYPAISLLQTIVDR